MSQNVQAVEFARSLLGVIREQQLSFLAAAVAYYAFVSLFPLVLLAIAVASAVAGQSFATQVTALLQDFLTEEAATLLETALASASGRGTATVVSLAVLLWSSLRLFRGLDVAFSRIYGAESPVSLPTQIRNALVVLGGITVALGATAVVATILPLADVPFTRLLGPIFLVVVLAATFFPLYYVFPARSMTVRGAIPGAVLAAGGWTLLSTAFGVYADQAAGLQVYGVVGGVLLVLTWFYLGGLIVLLGAALNATIGDRQLQQGALRDDTQRMSEPEDSPDEEGDGDGDGDAVSTVEPETVDYADFADLKQQLDALEEDIDERTVHREELEGDLKQYVRARMRRGHARGWGPYLVLLYGTIMTLGAFYFLSGGWAILAMLVVWLSTLGLYVLMVLVGLAGSALGVPGRAIDKLRNLR